MTRTLEPRRSRRFVHADEERSEVFARAFPLGPAADDELLLADDLELAPIRRALARRVPRVRALRDQSFPGLVKRARVQAPAVAAHLLAEANHFGFAGG